MSGPVVRTVTKGVFLSLIAAFLLLAGFVLAVSGVLQPSTGRIVLAAVALVAGLVLARTGHQAFRSAARQGEKGHEADHDRDA